MDFLMGIGASLAASIIGVLLGYVIGGVRYKKTIDEAPRKYVEYLGDLIFKAEKYVNCNDEEEVIINARAVVSTRDDIRRHLIVLTKVLNLEIDRLARELGYEYEGFPSHKGKYSDEREPDVKALRKTLIVLAKKWPMKKDQIEFEIRKVISELGLDRIFFKRFGL